MKTILAKFKVGSVTNFGNNNIEVKMTPVVSGSDENKSFSLYTPSGDCRLHITNPDVTDFFEAGSEYYVEFKDEQGHRLWENSDELKQWLNDNGYPFKIVNQSIILGNGFDPFSVGQKYGISQVS